MSSGKENTATLKQRSEIWFSERVGKVTSSKAPALFGLQGKKEFMETWDCVLNKEEEPSKNFRNFQRGIIFKSYAVECFQLDSSAEVRECGLFLFERERRFEASPDRIFHGGTGKGLMDMKNGAKIELTGLCLLETLTIARVKYQRTASPEKQILLDSYEKDEDIDGNDRNEKSHGKHFDSGIGSRNSSFYHENAYTADEKGILQE
ncbi:hypothetical protein AWC38_SpisGene12703 [Stylophora pistillata]|uniref:Uncharacterized protein n=1 Tax=Stylophora pistillata TaxID=50429 RepID=A0A2B4RYN3_STYPI|nr:hypothetical protein AWC38_SpisGene12703 [Stylophora pistillata]